MITFALVRVGTRYSVEYVEKMRNMIRRHCRSDHRIICLTDQPEQVEGVTMLPASLPKWWSKMLLFDPRVRGQGRCIYFDLDTVICGDLSPLIHLETQFGICANFTRRAGHLEWPCSYGSCVMTFEEGWGDDIYQAFSEASARIMETSGRYGDQYAIERLMPCATLLQDVLPPNYFVGRREMTSKRPVGAALLIFAGREKPHNTPHEWIRKEWR